MKLSENALKILNARYLLKDEHGRVIETPEQMFMRVSHTVAKPEDFYGNDAVYWEKRFYSLMTAGKFMPNTPALMNAGKKLGQLAACFVLPVEDSMLSIFDTLKNAAIILQSGGGTGFSFSHLRPKDDIVRSTGGMASGPVSFIKVYNSATDIIKQGGARRGANMGILRIDHPDILEFIRVKRDDRELTNFNISVSITDAFMDALKRDDEYDLVNPRSGIIIAKLKARLVFDEIVRSAWETGDPGLIFIDRINNANPTPHIGAIESTNPCGEQPLLPYEACVLGSINLSEYVSDGQLDYDQLSIDIKTAVRFLDDSIDANRYPMPEIEKMHKGNRKIGLGVMGWADTLILMGIPYNDSRSFSLAREVMKYVRDTARQASVELALKRGVFPNFLGSIYDRPGMPRVRNTTVTTVAPTGTIATIADCSSGIEPLFAIAYKRLILDTEMQEVNRHFVSLARMRGFFSEDLINRIMETGTLGGIEEIPDDVRPLFRTALDIPYEDHIEMQVAFQEYTDNAVSKTINLPYEAKEEDVARAYLLAYDKGLKGITVFRYGARKGTLVKFSDAD